MDDRIIDSNLNDAYTNQTMMNYRYSDEVVQVLFSSISYKTQSDNSLSVVLVDDAYFSYTAKERNKVN